MRRGEEDHIPNSDLVHGAALPVIVRMALNAGAQRLKCFHLSGRGAWPLETSSATRCASLPGHHIDDEENDECTFTAR